MPTYNVAFLLYKIIWIYCFLGFRAKKMEWTGWVSGVVSPQTVLTTRAPTSKLLKLQHHCKKVTNSVTIKEAQLIFVTTTQPAVVYFFQAGVLLHRERDIFAYFGQFWLFWLLWCTFYRHKQCGSVPKLTNIMYDKVAVNLKHLCFFL